MPESLFYKRVTTNEEVEAYYSNYGGQPPQYFKPGDIGIVWCEDLPNVSTQGTFCCVDFVGNNGKLWRCALTRKQVVVLPDDIVATAYIDELCIDFCSIYHHWTRIWNEERRSEDIRSWLKTFPIKKGLVTFNAEQFRTAPESVILL